MVFTSTRTLTLDACAPGATHRGSISGAKESNGADPPAQARRAAALRLRRRCRMKDREGYDPASAFMLQVIFLPRNRQADLFTRRSADEPDEAPNAMASRRSRGRPA
jgi:hypothetical protein